MKKIAISTLLICTVALPLAHADESHHPEKSTGSSAAATSAPGMGAGMMDMAKMQEMHKMMERIQQSTDPAERQQLMGEHMQEMHKMMGEMQGMMGKGMGGSAVPGDERQQMMEKRLDMMQGMMEQMMGHMMAAEGMNPAPGAAGQHDHQKQMK